MNTCELEVRSETNTFIIITITIIMFITSIIIANNIRVEQRVRINAKNDGAPIIILMHEQVDETVHLLPWIIEYLVDRGYVFGDMSNLNKSHMFER